MPEWAISGLIQAAIGLLMLGRMSSLLDNLKDDVKDMQRSKLDTAVHVEVLSRLEDNLEHLDQKQDTNYKTLDHKINNANQRVVLLEQRK